MAHLQVIRGGEVLGMSDYVWLDDKGKINSKKKSIIVGKNGKGEPEPILDRWTFFDYPSPFGPFGEFCDDEDQESPRTLVLVPCFYLPDPTRPQPCYIVICELRDEEDHCIKNNDRAKLRHAIEDRGMQSNLVWFGFEQNYTLDWAGSDSGNGFEATRFAAAERHIGACFDSGILFHSAWNPPEYDIWDFKVGYRAFPQDLDPDPPNALIVADHLIVARYLMEKICGSKGLSPYWEDLDIFISTAAMREPGGNEDAEAVRIENALQGKGDIRRLPHPTRGGVQCIELNPKKPNNPYTMAHAVLTAVWPQNMFKIK